MENLSVGWESVVGGSVLIWPVVGWLVRRLKTCRWVSGRLSVGQWRTCWGVGGELSVVGNLLVVGWFVIRFSYT